MTEPVPVTLDLQPGSYYVVLLCVCGEVDLIRATDLLSELHDAPIRHSFIAQFEYHAWVQALVGPEGERPRRWYRIGGNRSRLEGGLPFREDSVLVCEGCFDEMASTRKAIEDGQIRHKVRKAVATGKVKAHE